MPPKKSQDNREEIYADIVSACRQVLAHFSSRQADLTDSEKPRSAELDLYRQNLGAGLERLRGTFQEKLGDTQRD